MKGLIVVIGGAGKIIDRRLPPPRPYSENSVSIQDIIERSFLPSTSTW
jgi:hypothetical protein